MMSPERVLQVILAGTVAASAVLAFRLFRTPRPRRRARAIPFATSLACVGALVWGRFIEPFWIETTTTHIKWKGPPLRVALLGDLHAGRMLAPEIREAVERTNAAHPDVVVLAGDFISAFDADPGKLAILDELRALSPRVGTFAVLGNHDTEPAGSVVPRADVIAKHLEDLGIVVLRNAWRPVVPGVTIVGLGDYDARDSDGPKAFANAPDGATLLAAHNPASMKAGDNGRFDVGLAAHTHGGQICVPILRYCPVTHDSADPYLAGLYTMPSGVSLYVTRGIGESGLKARFASRPEIAILELSP